MKTNRRKFIQLSFLTLSLGSLGIALERNYFSKDDGNIKNINKFHEKRRSWRKENLEEKIQADLKRNRTVWIGKRLYTYAELN